MRILFTGASSFTGMWFVSSLIKRGHEVVLLFPKRYQDYEEIRKVRVDRLLQQTRAHFEVPFGSEPFFEVIQSSPEWDLLCHHAAFVKDYKSADFNVAVALENNTRQLSKVLLQMKEKGLKHLLLTGTVFEPNEGQGCDSLEAVSPYGLSKGLTRQVFEYYCNQHHLPLSHFVIANPFGSFEEMRFTSYLAKEWLNGKRAEVRYPLYERDNIPVTLLAECYAEFAIECFKRSTSSQINPSFYVGSQESFVKKMQDEMKIRLAKECQFISFEQKEFLEPKRRVNTDLLSPEIYGWKELSFWDDLANYYREAYGAKN